MSAKSSLNGGAGATAMPTLGDVIYADASRKPVSENDWIAVVRAIAAGDVGALRTIYDATHRIVFTAALRSVGGRDAAETVTAEVFEAVSRDAHGFDASRETVVGWIMNLARERAMVCRRAHMELLRRQFHGASKMLSVDERTAIEIAYFGRRGPGETAALLQQPVRSVRSRIRSGLQKLRRMMDAHR